MTKPGDFPRTDRPIRRVETPMGPATDINGVCRLAGCARRTVYNWIGAGKVTTCRTPNGRQWIVIASLWVVSKRPRDWAREEDPIAWPGPTPLPGME